MPGQRNFFGGREIARPEVGHLRSDDEGRFGQIHLARDGQPRLIVQIIGVEDHRARITGQPRGGEGVDLHEGIRG